MLPLQIGQTENLGLDEIKRKVCADSAISRKVDTFELSVAHLAAVNRRRRIYVNNDVGYDSVAMRPKLTAIQPDEWIAARFSAFDRLELRLQLSPEAWPEQIAVKFNGIQLQPQRQEGNWWVSALTPQQTAPERNLLTLDVAKPSERVPAISLEKVEVHVKYRTNKLGD